MRFLDFWNHHIIIYHPEKSLSRKKELSFILSTPKLKLNEALYPKIEILILDIMLHESCKIEGLKLSNSHLGRKCKNMDINLHKFCKPNCDLQEV